MKKKFVALLLILTIFALTVASVLLLTVLPMTLTGCCLNPYHARFNSPYGNNSYLDLDYIESLEMLGTNKRRAVYLIDDESVFKKALPGYGRPIDFNKQIAILYIYYSNQPEYYVHSIKLNDGALTIGVFHTKIYLPGFAGADEPILRCFVLTMDKLSFDSVEFIDVRSGGIPT